MGIDDNGNITLHKAGYFTLSLDLDGEDLTNADIKLYVEKVEIVILPTRDPADPKTLYFTFTTEHAETIGSKELEWIVREVVNGVPEVIVEGGNITAEGFAV